MSDRIKPEELTWEQIYEEAEKEQKDYHSECERVNGRLLRVIQKVKGKRFAVDLKDLIEWAEVRGQYEIVRKPDGKLQKTATCYHKINRYWVRQWTTLEDCYHGYIYVKIKLGRWIKMYYEC